MLVPTPADTRPDSRSCSLWYIAGRLGQRERSERWIADQVAQLVELESFPPPLPLFSVSKRRRVAGITGARRWNRDAVDAWFDGLIPPGLVAAIETRTAALHAATLDARAAELAA
jgi:hypothetical protein